MTSPNAAWSPDGLVAPGELLMEALAERGMTQADSPGASRGRSRR